MPINIIYTFLTLRILINVLLSRVKHLCTKVGTQVFWIKREKNETPLLLHGLPNHLQQ